MTKHYKNLLKIVAANVRERRVAMGISQEKFADLAGYHRTYVGSVERGERNITLSTLCAFAAALKTDVRELLSESND